MKILQTFLTCLTFLIGQVALSYAVDPKGKVIPVPANEGIHWGGSIDISGTTLIANEGIHWGGSIDISGTTLAMDRNSVISVTMTVSISWNGKEKNGKY